jgi:hypothetical protein
MLRKIIPLLAVALASCVYEGGDPPPLAPLAEDAGEPALALLEHVLTGHFAGAGATPPTTCASLQPGPLSADHEAELIARFVRLAPAARCRPQGAAVVDADTGAPAVMVQVYQFVCAQPTLCSGWVAAPGVPAARYQMRFENGAWRFDSDRRLLAE